MKRTFKFFAVCLAMAGMTFVSCQKEMKTSGMDINEERLEQDDRFAVSLDGTKTTIDSLQVKWAEGDSISVNGVIYELAEFYEDSTRAEFKKKYKDQPSPKAPFNAFYPASISNGAGASGNLLAKDTYNAETVNLPMYAVSTDRSLAFKNICAALKVNVSSSFTVKSIKITTDKAVNGAFTISDNVAVMDKTSGLTDNDKSVTLDCGSGVEGTSFYIPIPAATYNDLQVTLTRDGGTTDIMTATAESISISANTIYGFDFRTPEKIASGTYTLNAFFEGDVEDRDLYKYPKSEKYFIKDYADYGFDFNFERVAATDSLIIPTPQLMTSSSNYGAIYFGEVLDFCNYYYGSNAPTAISYYEANGMEITSIAGTSKYDSATQKYSFALFYYSKAGYIGTGVETYQIIPGTKAIKKTSSEIRWVKAIKPEELNSPAL